jgi:hypothetical protein
MSYLSPEALQEYEEIKERQNDLAKKLLGFGS